MRIAWVLPDGERQRRFDKFQKAAPHNKFSQYAPASAVNDSSKMAAVSPLVSVPSSKLSVEELGLLKAMNEKTGNMNM